MENFGSRARHATIALLLFGLGVGPSPTSAQAPGAWVPLAKKIAILGSRSEQAGNFDEALDNYRLIIAAATDALKNPSALDPASDREGYILLAAGHIDAARVLLMKAATPAVRQREGAPTIAALLADLAILQHTQAAEKALKTAEALEQQDSEECARKNRGKPIREIAICFTYAAIINAELGDLRLLKGDPVQARSFFLAALKQRPNLEHAKTAITHLDEVDRIENGSTTGYMQKVRGWAVQILGADLTRKAGVLLIKDLVGRSNPLAGSISAAVADPLIERMQVRLKSN
jgi:tetratricopeptide (TPR) repeat protein